MPLTIAFASLARANSTSSVVKICTSTLARSDGRLLDEGLRSSAVNRVLSLRRGC